MPGNSFGLKDYTVYLKKEAVWDPYQWGGGCMKMGDIKENLGGQSMTHKVNSNGEVVRDTVRDEVPGDVSFELSFKKLQYDRMRSILMKCRWNVDLRAHCGQWDNPSAWLDIRRITFSKATERGDTGLDWTSTDDAMVTLPFVGLEAWDIWHVTGAPYSW